MMGADLLAGAKDTPTLLRPEKQSLGPVGAIRRCDLIKVF
jgi:hypothetical protein